ncbi:MAG: hypothetical protein QG623_644 [Patescibacteria group bacterium]|nr:hypothetical protein [Patescibacteria group bacterium]
MSELQRVIEAGELFMDALGGEFVPGTDPDGRTHTLARLVRNILEDEGPPEVLYGGDHVTALEKVLGWAPAKASVHCVPFEMRSFGRYGANGEALFIPVSLRVNFKRSEFSVQTFGVELFHPILYSYELQPDGPIGRFDSGGYLSFFSVSFGSGSTRNEQPEGKIGLCEVRHGHKARELVTELAKNAFSKPTHEEPS